MAFWAMKKHKWFQRNIPDMIKMFKEYLYNEWYNSLSEEDKLKEEKRNKQEKENSLKMLHMLVGMTSILESKLDHQGY